MKKKLQAMLTTKETRKTALDAKRIELRGKSDKSDDLAEIRGITLQLDAVNAELDSINAEIPELRSAIADIPDVTEPIAGGNTLITEPQARSASPIGGAQIIGTYGIGQSSAAEERSKEINAKYEQRGIDLKAKKPATFELDELPEFRAVTLASGTLINPVQYSSTLNPTFNEVSGTIDLVNAVNLPGGESYEKGFEVSTGEGGYTAETGDYTETDPVFEYVSIGKAKITAYAEMTDEAMKLPNINYQALVAKSITTAIRKKISKQILIGAGGANALTGIFNAPVKAIPVATDISISAIDSTTLDKVVFGYGGNEEVEGSGYLILNKTDLAAFAAIRATDGKKLYDITLNGNSGTISSDGSYSVPFIINSACPALSATGTAVSTYCMAYGMLKAYEMPVFSALSVEESRDYKFRTGQIAYRGAIWVGGNVASYKGFVRIKKVAAV